MNEEQNLLESYSGRFEDLCRWGDAADIQKALRGRLHADKTDPNSSFTVYEVWKKKNKF